MNDTQDTSLSAVYAETPRRAGMRREFTSQKALQDHAEQTGQVCVLEGIALSQRQLSPDQYEIVDVRTSRRVLRPALLIPKAVLKALWEAELPFREALGIKREREN
jgi:hypothetical protein